MCLLGTFSERTVVNEARLHEDRRRHPVDAAALRRLRRRYRLGHGGRTRRGRSRATPSSSSAPAASASTPSRVPRIAGAERIVVVDPVEFKREKALELGATHTAAGWDSGFDLLQELTGADWPMS